MSADTAVLGTETADEVESQDKAGLRAEMERLGVAAREISMSEGTDVAIGYFSFALASIEPCIANAARLGARTWPCGEAGS